MDHLPDIIKTDNGFKKIEDPSIFLYFVNTQAILERRSTRDEELRKVKKKTSLSVPTGEKHRFLGRKTEKNDFTLRKFAKQIMDTKKTREKNQKLNEFLSKKLTALNQEFTQPRSKNETIIYKRPDKTPDSKNPFKYEYNLKGNNKKRGRKNTEIFYSKYTKAFNSKIMGPKSAKGKKFNSRHSLKVNTGPNGITRFGELRREKQEPVQLPVQPQVPNPVLKAKEEKKHKRQEPVPIDIA